MNIVLLGEIDSGKSSVARYLQRRYGFTVLKSAGIPKAMLRKLGLSPEQIEGKLKNLPDPSLNGLAPRQLMIDLCNWLRDEFGQDVLARQVNQRRAQFVQMGKKSFVCDDIRMQEECQMLVKAGWKIFQIIRPNLVVNQAAKAFKTDPTEAHAQTRGQYPTVVNDDTLQDLFKKVEQALGL